jgi:nicotinamidase-related amidase
MSPSAPEPGLGADLPGAGAYYARIGFAGRVGFGRRPAVVVIDCIHACANPALSPIGIAMDEELRSIRRLLDRMRAKRFPVVHTTVVIQDGALRDAGWFAVKVPAMASMRPGSKLVEFLPEVAPVPGEVVLEKRFPSAFYGTVLQSYLTRCGVDTLIVTGNSTSGCVRATVIDAVSGGFRVIVPRECVADRVPLSHAVILFDMDSKYGDVMELDAVLAAVDALPASEPGE